MTPDNPPALTAFLVVKNGLDAIDFYKAAFQAKLLAQYNPPGEKVNAKLSIGETVFWLGDEEPEFDNLGPESLGGSPVRFVLTVDDPDAVFATALAAGATQICPVTVEASWKIGKLKDPFGHIWEIGHPLDES